MDVLRVDLNQGDEDTHPVVNVELWDGLPDDTADYLYFDASEHGGVSVGYTWSENSESFTAPGVTTPVRTQLITSPMRCADIALPDDPTKFLLSLDELKHGATGPRAFYVSFSTDGCETFREPARVSLPVAADTAVSVEVEFYRSASVAKGASSSTLGDLGVVVLPGANGIRVGLAVGGELRDDLTAGTITLSGAAQ